MEIGHVNLKDTLGMKDIYFACPSEMTGNVEKISFILLRL